MLLAAIMSGAAGQPAPESLVGSPAGPRAALSHANVKVSRQDKSLHTQWAGARVAFLGDSMTDKRTLGPETTLWWEYLSQLLGFGETYCYGVNGHQWHQILGQARKLHDEHPDDVDAILIFAGTNDYNAGVPVGNFFDEEEVEVEVKGPQIVRRKHRIPVMGDATFCGRINDALCFLKTHYPDIQIIVMTPIHRGYAKFNDKNVQPDEFYCNGQGLFLEDYVSVLKQGCAYWSVPVVDLYGESGIVPNLESNNLYIAKPATDRLHPSTEGQWRIARLLQYQLPRWPVRIK